MLVYALPKLYIAPNNQKVAGRNIKQETPKIEKMINATGPYNIHVYLAKYI